MGFTIFAFSLWQFSQITADWGFWQLFGPQAIRGFAILLCIVPAVGMALNGAAPSELRYASGLFNLMRNLGGAIGIAVVTTWLGDFGRFHAARIGESMAPQQAGELIGGLNAYAQGFTSDPARALGLAQAKVAAMVGREAATLAFADTFRLMAWAFILALVIVPFCRPAPGSPGGAPMSEH